MITERLIQIAKEIALTSAGVGPKLTFRVGAIIFDRRSRVASYSFNSYKTHPGLRNHYRYPCRHAEAGAILKAMRINKNLSDLSLLVVRIRKDGRLTMAKPCSECRRYMIKAGITSFYFSDWKGEIQFGLC